MESYTEKEKHFLASFEERYGQIDKATEEMVIKAYIDGYKQGLEEGRRPRGVLFEYDKEKALRQEREEGKREGTFLVFVSVLDESDYTPEQVLDKLEVTGREREQDLWMLSKMQAKGIERGQYAAEFEREIGR